MACQGRQPRSGGAARAPLDRAAASGPIDGSGAPSVTALKAEPPVSSKCPLDATVAALQAGDVLAGALLEQRLPGHELKSEPILYHCEAPADEAGDASEAPTHMLAGIRWHVG
jgi:hypothetical protein